MENIIIIIMFQQLLRTCYNTEGDNSFLLLNIIISYAYYYYIFKELILVKTVDAYADERQLFPYEYYFLIAIETMCSRIPSESVKWTERNSERGLWTGKRVVLPRPVSPPIDLCGKRHEIVR